MEVHVHGNLYLCKGVTRAQIVGALQPWLEHMEADDLDGARSLEPDEPGIAFDEASRTLEICWTGEIDGTFQADLEQSLQALGPYTEQATEVEVSYYQDNGNDDMQVIFVGPSPEAIHEAQRARMVEEVKVLLARHFGGDEVDEAVSLVHDLFDRDWSARLARGEFAQACTLPPGGPQRKYLH